MKHKGKANENQKEMRESEKTGWEKMMQAKTSFDIHSIDTWDIARVKVLDISKKGVLLLEASRSLGGLLARKIPHTLTGTRQFVRRMQEGTSSFVTDSNEVRRYPASCQ